MHAKNDWINVFLTHARQPATCSKLFWKVNSKDKLNPTYKIQNRIMLIQDKSNIEQCFVIVPVYGSIWEWIHQATENIAKYFSSTTLMLTFQG